jgi:hypothetical protein
MKVFQQQIVTLILAVKPMLRMMKSSMGRDEILNERIGMNLFDLSLSSPTLSHFLMTESSNEGIVVFRILSRSI